MDENTNALVGYICGARDGFVEKQNKDLLPTIITSFLTRPYLVFTKKFIDLAGIKLRSFIGKDDDLEFEAYERTLPSPIFSVNVFALSPEYRDKGFGIFLLDTLMNEFFSAAKAKGAKTVSGTIWTENKPIYSYYKLRKWIQAPGNPQDKRTRFYKIL